MDFEISFCAQGSIKQRVEITDPGMTAERLQDLLNKGDAVTTVQEGGDVVLLLNEEERVIGKVVDVDNSLEYCEFEVEKD